MKILNQRIQVNLEIVETCQTGKSASRIRCLLIGLEQQKEELGPIAVELIMLLNRLGVVAATASNPHQVGGKT